MCFPHKNKNTTGKEATNLKPRRHTLNPQHNIFLQQRQQHSPHKNAFFSIYKKEQKKAAARHSIAYYTKARRDIKSR